MRRLILAFVLLASLAAPLARAADVAFVRVWPGWRDAEAFDSISEHFTGAENSHGRTVLRTHADSRAGFYYLVRVANPDAALTGTHFVLQVITPDSPDPKTYTFPADLPTRSTVFQLGLTGADWPDRRTHPVAWRLELRSSDDRVLASQQSFLWALPAK